MVDGKGDLKAVRWGLHSVDALVATKVSQMAAETAAWKDVWTVAQRAADWGMRTVVLKDCLLAVHWVALTAELKVASKVP